MAGAPLSYLKFLCFSEVALTYNGWGVNTAMFWYMDLWAPLQQEVQNGNQHSEKMAMFKERQEGFTASNLCFETGIE